MFLKAVQVSALQELYFSLLTAVAFAKLPRGVQGMLWSYSTVTEMQVWAIPLSGTWALHNATKQRRGERLAGDVDGKTRNMKKKYGTTRH